MSFFGLNFGSAADIDIILDNQDERKMAEIRDENGRKERHYLYFDGESVNGKVNVTLHRKTNRLEHQGIKIEFIGQIELYYDRGNHHEFLSLVKELARPGDITQNTSFDFEFNQVEKPYECYTGANVKLRYFLRVTIVRRLTDMTKEMDLLVHTLSTFPEMNNPIKMEVGIEECLHIEFEYNKSKYHLKDVIVGKIYFLLVRIKIKHMEVAIIKRETTGSGPNTFHDNETIAKYEIMDGAPVKGESIPIRVFLAGYDLTPTMRDINKKFSVKYYLNLVLVDEEERRYFKQQEITLWRKSDRPRKLMHGGSNYPAGMMHGAYQVPHALARHNPGDRPTHNVRTAPTPTTEEPSFIAQSSQVDQDPQSFTGQSGQNPAQVPGGQTYRKQEDRSPIQEEEECGDDIENLSCNKDESTSPVEEHTSKQVDEPSEPINASLRQDPDQIECTTESVGKLIIDEVKEENSNADTEIQKETTNVQSTEEESISAIPIISNENDKPRDTKIPQKELDEDEDDSRPMPPDDDSVPDMEDSLIADGVDHEEVEEYINNNVSNDEDGDVSPFATAPKSLSSKSAKNIDDKSLPDIDNDDL